MLRLTELKSIPLNAENRRYRRRQAESPSPSRTFYLFFICLILALNAVRCLIDVLTSTLKWADIGLVILEAVSNSIIYGIEISVVVFILLSRVPKWTDLLKRAALIVGILFGIYAIGQIPLIALNYRYILAFGYYSLFNYWMITNLVWVLIYAVLLCFKAFSVSIVRMPTKPIFTIYLLLMMLVHALFAVDCICINYFDLTDFFCVSAILGLVHYLAFLPLLYYSFLFDYVFGSSNTSFSEMARSHPSSVPNSPARVPYLIAEPGRSRYIHVNGNDSESNWLLGHNAEDDVVDWSHSPINDTIVPWSTSPTHPTSADQQDAYESEDIYSPEDR